VLKAVSNVNGHRRGQLVGLDVHDQRAIDAT
jgi:enolase